MHVAFCRSLCDSRVLFVSKSGSCPCSQLPAGFLGVCSSSLQNESMRTFPFVEQRHCSPEGVCHEGFTLSSLAT